MLQDTSLTIAELVFKHFFSNCFFIDVGSTNQGSIIEESDFIDDADASDCEWEKEDSDATVTSSDDDDNLVPARRVRLNNNNYF